MTLARCSTDQTQSRGEQIRTIRLMNVRLDDIDADTLLKTIVAAVRERRRLLVVNANAHLMNLAQGDRRLVRLFDRADIAFCDGAGVQFAIWLCTRQRPARHTPPQWIIPLGRRLAEEKATVFWLGGTLEMVQKAAQNFETATGMRVVGFQHGFFDLRAGSGETAEVIDRINAAKPDLLLVNLGMPRQEVWLDDNWNQLDVTVALTGGALVDHVAGAVKRPPLWVADSGFEWLVRLVVEPRRLWRRYVFGLPRFGARVLISFIRRDLVVYNHISTEGRACDAASASPGQPVWQVRAPHDAMLRFDAAGKSSQPHNQG